MSDDPPDGWNKTQKLDRRVQIQVGVNLVRQNLIETNGWLMSITDELYRYKTAKMCLCSKTRENDCGLLFFLILAAH